MKRKKSSRSKRKKNSNGKVFLIILVLVCIGFGAYIYFNEYKKLPQSAMIPCDSFTQTENYYCGPACVKIVLDAINRESEKQDVYAKEMGTNSKEGTYASKIVEALNKHQNKRKYEVVSKNTSYEQFVKGLVYAISKNCPVIVSINTNKLDEDERKKIWGYSVQGHFITVVGYSYTGDDLDVFIHDPHYEKPGYYKKMSCKNLFNANQKHPSMTTIW